MRWSGRRRLSAPATVLAAAVGVSWASVAAGTAQASVLAPSMAITTAYPSIMEAAVSPVTVTLTSGAAMSSATMFMTGARSSVCTPVTISRSRTSGTATCWNTAGGPGTMRLVGTAKVVTAGLVTTVTSPALSVKVAARVAPGVPAARYNEIHRCGNTTRNVWLTFDDSGSAAQVSSILSTLRRNNIKARMFPIGTWARANPSLVAAMKRDGHIIDNHTATHANLATASPTKVLYEIDHGATPSTSVRLLRPPGGAGAFTTRLTALAGSRGYKVCYWTVDTRDWAGATTAEMVRKVRYGDALTPPVEAGGVVLMHFHGRHTAAGLQSVIDAVRARGLTLQPRT